MSLWRSSAIRALGLKLGCWIRASWIFGIFAAFAVWCGNLLRESWIFRILTEQRKDEPTGNLSSLLRAKFRNGLQAVFHALRLNRALQGSIFLKSAFWCALPIILAPLVPTMVVLALVIAAFASMVLTLGTQRSLQPWYSSLNKWVLLYACIYAFATCTSVAFRDSLFVGLISVFFLLAYFVIITAIRSWSQLHRLMICMLGVSVLVALYGFWQFLHPEQYASTWLDTDMFSSITLRVYSTLANPNVLGTYFLLVIPFAVAMLLTAPSMWKKLACLAMCALLLLCLALTYSRGCYLGLLFAAAVFLILLDRRFLILFAALVVLCPFYLPETIITRFTSIGDMSDSSTSYRVYIWMGTLRMLKDYWFCGIGPGETAFNLVYPLYGYDAIVAPHAHNLFLQITCDTGVVGLATFLSLLVSYFRSLFTALRNETSKKVRIFQIAAISAVSGFLLEGMTDYTFYNYRVTFLFWAILGIGTLLAHGSMLMRNDLNGVDPWPEEETAGTRKIRVLNIISDTNIGGAGRCLLNYLKYCDRERYEIAVLLPAGSQLKPAVEKLGAVVLEADIEGDRSFDLKAIPLLRRMVAAAEPDVIHTHGSMSGRIAARNSSARLIYTRHSAFPVPESLKHGPKHWANRLVSEIYADRIISVSPATVGNLTDSGVRRDKIDIVLNGVEPVPRATQETQNQWRKRLNLQPGDFVVGILARLEEYKGHMLLLEAAASLKAQGYPIKVLIAGTGDYEENIALRLHELNLEGTVSMLGFTTQVAEFLSILDVQANCSFGTEATSLSLLEGFSMGLPAVVSNYGGNPWVVEDGQNGLIFESKDPVALANCLKGLMDDQTQLTDMSIHAREIFEERFTGRIYAGNIECVYQKVLER